MKQLLASVLLVLVSSGASAGFMEKMVVMGELGYAQAAVDACPSLQINPVGVLALVKLLDAEDQAGLSQSIIEVKKEDSAKLFDMLGDSSCEAALDYETKLGIDIFIQK